MQITHFLQVIIICVYIFFIYYIKRFIVVGFFVTQCEMQIVCITNEPIRCFIYVRRSKYKSVTLSDARIDKRRFNAKPPHNGSSNSVCAELVVSANGNSSWLNYKTPCSYSI